MTMKYKTLTRGDARQIRMHLINDQEFSLDTIGETLGDGDDLDVSEVQRIAEAAAIEVVSGANSEDVEQRYSGNIYLALRSVPVGVRDDTGFWRWITLGPLLAFTRLRDPKFGVEALGVGSNVADILACRMFLRGQVSRVTTPDGNLEFALATSPGIKTHDFWQSHVLRRTTGAEVNFAQALIKWQSDEATKMMSDELRPFVRDSINRKKRILATFLMSGDEATAYLEHERATWGGSTEDDEELEDDLD